MLLSNFYKMFLRMTLSAVYSQEAEQKRSVYIQLHNCI